MIVLMCFGVTCAKAAQQVEFVTRFNVATVSGKLVTETVNMLNDMQKDYEFKVSRSEEHTSELQSH